MEPSNQKKAPLSVIRRMLEKKEQIIAERKQRRMAVQPNQAAGRNGMPTSALS